MGGGRGRQNSGQILNVSFRYLHPYRLWDGELFCLLVMQQKLDPGVPSPTLFSDFSASSWWGKMILKCRSKYIFLKLEDLPTSENEKKIGSESNSSYFRVIAWPFFKYFKDLTTDILIFYLIFPSNFKTTPFCKPCVFIEDEKKSFDNFYVSFRFRSFWRSEVSMTFIPSNENWAYDKCKYMKDRHVENAISAIWLCSIIWKKIIWHTFITVGKQ